MMKKNEFTISEDTEQLFRQLFLHKYGQSLDEHIFKSFICVLRDRMKKLKIKSPYDYYNYLVNSSSGTEEQNELLDLITIGETYFFRNLPQFDALEKSILPEIIQNKLLSQNKSLRIWSAGCSSGDEPYSIAIILKELLPDIDNWDISLLATDINRISLAKAQRGYFTKKSIKHVPEEFLNKYFKQSKGYYVINQSIKDLVNFKRLNLMNFDKELPETKELDIIFCRNVTIYFDISYTKKLISKFYNFLNIYGVLFLGHSETLYNISIQFTPVEYKNAFIYKKMPSSEEKTTLIQSKKTIKPVKRKKSPDKVLEKTLNKKKQKNTKLKKQVSVKQIPIKEEKRTKEFDFSEEFNKAVKYANTEKYSEAIKILKQLLRVDNLHTRTYYMLGILSTKIQDYSDAEYYFRRVLYNEPESAMAYFNLAELYLKQKKIISSKREYKNAINILKKLLPGTQLMFSENFSANFLLQICQTKLSKIKL